MAPGKRAILGKFCIGDKKGATELANKKKFHYISLKGGGIRREKEEGSFPELRNQGMTYMGRKLAWLGGGLRGGGVGNGPEPRRRERKLKKRALRS